jgi:hypothetical protein
LCQETRTEEKKIENKKKKLNKKCKFDQMAGILLFDQMAGTILASCPPKFTKISCSP